MRSKRRSAGSCACGPGASRGQPRLVESTELVQPHDEYDTSAYLYIYAYTLKRAKVANKGARRRERTTVTLRFRSFDRYEDNLREASRWRLAIKCLLNRLPVPKAYMSPAHRNLQSLLSGESEVFFFFFARERKRVCRRKAPGVFSDDVPIGANEESDVVLRLVCYKL